jgi:hypothetical protein
LSYGGGVNSTAMLFLIIKKKLPLDEVIFSDTGAEMPETYDYLPKIQEYCKKIGIKFTIVRGKVGIGRENTIYTNNLRDYCFKVRIIPFRKFRSCTEKFKIVPIHNYLKKTYGCKIVMYIGFDFGELRRKRSSTIDWIEYRHPLIDAEINREGCKQVIIEAGFPVPDKSGCYICPFQKISDWKELMLKHRNLFDDAMLLEERARERVISQNGDIETCMYCTIPLKMLDKATKEQRSIGEFVKEPCEHGWCMT